MGVTISNVKIVQCTISQACGSTALC